jgi:aryl-alcohol dehydrogenase-like predicted oxidoreductase
MERRAFGKSGTQVPVIGMGTWKTFDVRGDAEESERSTIVDAAIEAGATFMDSSPMYGEAERVLGKALHGRREQTLVATKVWTRSGQYDPDQQIADALKYFGGYIDLYQVHNLNDTDLVLGKLERLRDEAKTKLLGVTHYLEEHFAEIAQWMRSGRIDAIQIPYNAARTSAAEELLPLAEELGLGVVVMVPLGSGALVKLPVSEKDLKPFADYGCRTWAQVLLKWVISDTRVHVAIPATSHSERMKENAEAGTGRLFDDATRARVQEIVWRY